MMKSGVVALGALSLINLAAAQPSGLHRRHQQLHEKRQEVDVVVETDYSYVTTQLPDVVVYVDENGNPYSTSTVGQTPATSAASSAVSVSTPVYTAPTSTAAAASSATTLSSIYVAPTTSSSVIAKAADVTTSEAAATTSKAAAVSVSVGVSLGAGTTSKSSATAAATSASGSGPTGYGIVYSPYSDDGGCKSASTVSSDFATIHSYAQSNGEDWSYVRIYGTDCSQVENVLSAAAEYDLEIFAGIYYVTDNDTVGQELQVIVDAVNGDWSRIQTIAIGNEVVNDGTLTVAEVKDRVTYARSFLASAGYSGNIVAVDTLVATVANPDLCDYSDYVAVNCHPFFDGSVAAADAGPWLLEQMESVSSVCGGKDTWITETGWPTQGDSNGDAVPSVENQKASISSIKSSISSNVIWLTAFNEMWKTNSASTFNAEQYWGICN